MSVNSNDTVGIPPAGWYPAPDGSGTTWWWDGAAWVPPTPAGDPESLADPEPAGKVRWKSASFEGVKLRGGRITEGKIGGPVTGATARVESGADIGRRITLTRMVAIGVFAFAARKQTGHVFLTIDHPEYQILVEVKAKQDGDARKFAALVNNEARKGV